MLEPILRQDGVNLYYDFPDNRGPMSTSKLNFFNSSWAVDTFGSATPIFNASRIFFHSPSEHTINGKRYDLELQTVHYPDDASGDIKGASMSVLFDIDDASEVEEEEEGTIDQFFETLDLEHLAKRDVFTFEAYFASVTRIVEENNRWAYKGSLSMPPCTGDFYI